MYPKVIYNLLSISDDVISFYYIRLVVISEIEKKEVRLMVYEFNNIVVYFVL